ncbi:MAG: ECF transporter S component [Oscillospiraceae bacterium]|jgi:riboflavin transporter FmnP|nr:ECF transporter S component [Oscillospiraceae bacterium]
MQSKTKKLTVLAMLSAMAYIVMVVGRIPIVLFLKYDPKDVIIVIAGFIYGPLSAFMISLAVSLVEMFTVSDNGFIGFFMNILSSCALACTASFIYKKRRTASGAVIGLAAGLVLAVAAMMLWNYFVTPIYMGMPREAVAGMLLPVFLPFNVLKHGLNLGITLLLYKPLVVALRKAHMIPEENRAPGGAHSRKLTVGVVLLGAGVVITCVMVVLVMNGIL